MSTCKESIDAVVINTSVNHRERMGLKDSIRYLRCQWKAAVASIKSKRNNSMSTLSRIQSTQYVRPSELASRLIASPECAELHKATMDLVTDTADYLDGKGRKQSSVMMGMRAVAYSRHAMEVTTSCMNSSAAVLTLRSAKARALPIEQAVGDVMKTSVLMSATTKVDPALQMPEELMALMDRANVLQKRIKKFTESLVAVDYPLHNPVHDSLNNLMLAFGTKL